MMCYAYVTALGITGSDLRPASISATSRKFLNALRMMAFRRSLKNTANCTIGQIRKKYGYTFQVGAGSALFAYQWPYVPRRPVIEINRRVLLSGLA